MAQNNPLVSIGVPTYNRSKLLKRTIESALNQTYRNIEIIISDNASTDNTEALCQQFKLTDERVKYYRQQNNLGPANNFAEVLRLSNGEYFMWLGDDDWIDENYVSSCVKEMSINPDLSLVCGTSQYYSNENKIFTGKIFNLTHNSPWQRVITYYAKVSDNGMFYGIMRKEQSQQIEIRKIMGGDWFIIACIVFMGKTKVLTETSVHRELGGASVSCKRIAKILNLPKLYGLFPMFPVAINAWKEIFKEATIYKKRPPFERFIIGGIIFLIILTTKGINFRKHLRWIKQNYT